MPEKRDADDVCIEFWWRRDGGGDTDIQLLKTVGNPNGQHRLLCIERNCHANCLMNKERLEAIAGSPLHLVAGSLGLCSPSPAWFEWGGDGSVPHQTAIQFRKCPVTGYPDVHFWLESDDGVVWDVLDPYMVTVAKVRGKRINTKDFGCGHLIRGKDKRALEGCGLLYVTASPIVQEVMKKHFGSKCYMIPLDE